MTSSTNDSSQGSIFPSPGSQVSVSSQNSETTLSPPTTTTMLNVLHLAQLKDMGKLSYFLGLQVQYKDNGEIFLNQSKYAKDLLHKAGLDTCKPVSTPCKPHSQFLASEGTPMSDPTMYRSLVGAL